MAITVFVGEKYDIKSLWDHLETKNSKCSQQFSAFELQYFQDEGIITKHLPENVCNHKQSKEYLNGRNIGWKHNQNI